MDDLDGIPRKGQETDGIRGLWKVIKKIRDDISVLQRSAAQRSMSLTDGGDLNISGSGKVRVTGSGDNFGTPYDVSMTIENFVTSSAVWGDVLSPGLNFRSLLTATEGYTRLYSPNGYGIKARTYDPAFGFGEMEVSPGEVNLTWSNPDEYRVISVAGSTMRIVHFDHTTNAQTGMTQYGGELLVGHSYPYTIDPAAEKRAVLRASLDGKLSLESKGTGEAGVYMPGDGTLDLRGALTSNGQPIGGAPEWSAVKNKPTSFPPSAHSHPTNQVTGLDTALAGKAATTFVNGLKRRFKRVPGTGLGTSIASSTTNWTSFGATVTVPADLFGVGVPYIITAYAQAAGWPVAGAVFSLRLLFSGTQPDGAKTNSPNGQHNATTTVSYDFEVTTSREVIVAAQAQSAFGSSAIGQGADQAFYTVTATPYTAF